MASDSTEKKAGKPLTLSRPGRLEIKKTIETGQVRQSFSHGRSKTVTVEVKRKRTFATGASGTMKEVRAPLLPPDPEPTAAPPVAPVEDAAPAAERPPQRTLTQSERAARTRAIEEAQRAAEEVALRVEAELAAAPPPAPAPEPQLDGREMAERTEAEELARLRAADTQRRTEEEARLAAQSEAQQAADEVTARAAETERRRRAAIPDEPVADPSTGPGRGRAKAAKAVVKPPTTRSRGGERRRAGKLTISEALSDEGGERIRSVAAFRRRQERERARAQAAAAQQQGRKIVRDVVIPDAITVGELANRMAERGGEVIKALMKMDIMATINQTIDQDTAELVVEEFGHNVKRVSEADVEIGIGGAADAEENLQPRVPVVTIMGHVDHGKTSLLDALRKTDVVAREAGGITQHIGAYQVDVGNGKKITFFDTPGHEAFTAMRQRGAQVTDIVVLVVAADDGVQPQTIEAINHAKAAEVPLIVAVNKIDRPQSDASRVKNELLSQEIVVEDMGGDVQCVEVSATEGTNLDKLVEAILLQAELLELKANPDRPAYGAVVEAKLERGRGPVATILVQRGTLKVGDIFIAGGEWGRARALVDDQGRPVKSAGPSVPVEVLGLSGTPNAGDEMAVMDSEARAREVTEYRQTQQRDRRAAAGGRGTIEQMFSRIAAGEQADVPLVVKADVQGSVEAIVGALEKMATDEVRPHILHAAVGGVTESDVSLASASGGMVVGFNVRANPQARGQAKRDGIDIRYYAIIYNVVDDVKALMTGKLAPKLRETHLGSAEIREVFNVTKVGKVAGCMITEGIVRRGSKVRVLRDNVVIHDGDLSTLRRFKEDVREVRDGYECGLALENYNDIKVGDTVECYEVEEVAREL